VKTKFYSVEKTTMSYMNMLVFKFKSLWS